MSNAAEEQIRVLHVEDEPGLADVVTTYLERQREVMTVVSEPSAEDGLERLATGGFDCIVSDHEMPGMNGLEFLRAVRESHPELPFVLFTGKGSEEIASEAISAGVTEYLQKETGTEQYTVLANRIERAVSAQRAKQALEESERTLSTLISNLPGTVYRCRNEPGWPMTFVSDGARELTGYSAAAIESGSVSWGTDIIVEADRQAMWTQVQNAINAGDPFEVTYRIETADGDERWMWERGRAVDSADGSDVIEGFITDITARKERERRLARYETLVESVSDPMYVMSPEGTIEMVNDAMAAALGYARDDIVGRAANAFMPEADVQKAEAVIRELLDDEDRTWAAFEMRSIAADGTVTQNENKIAVLTDEDGNFDGSVGVVRDISERKERERRLEGFANVVSHDLRNPLQVVQSHIQLAQENGDVEPLDAASDAAERMERLIDDLLRLAQDGRDLGTVQSVDLGVVATDAWNNLVTDGASLTVDTTRTVEADPDRLGELFENLFRNAIQHGATADEDHPLVIRVGDTDDGFFVEDDGVGIDPDRRDAVFDRGYTTSTDGTGFGLAIVESIVSAHGWDISVAESGAARQNTISGGARFEVAF